LADLPVLEDLVECVAEENPSLSEFECSIFNGRYVTGDIDQRYLQKLEQTRTVRNLWFRIDTRHLAAGLSRVSSNIADVGLHS
jgi:hypothetical protein